MKIRWTGHSVRLRISPSELDRLLAGGAVTETLTLPGGGRWSAVLVPADETGLGLEDGSLRFALGPDARARLAAPDAEGVYFHTDGEPPLRYFVEKDFPCAHPGAPEAQEPPYETFAPPPGFKERQGD